jgi:hypothetical protein
MATYDLATQNPNPNTLVTGDILNCSYSGTFKSITLPTGVYKLEVWGAQGGDYKNYLPSYRSSTGGYSIGTISLSSSITFYLYTGGKGTFAQNSSVAAGGFNGGGQARAQRYTNSGGGGSDIRINSTSLYARVIVAGGGGGGRDDGNQGNLASYSGAGGGASGLGGAWYGSTSLGTGRGGRPGTATAGGAIGNPENSETLFPGAFGIGGYTGSSSTYGVGGGGGWYGGGPGSADADGAGGSGYVYTSSTVSNYPSGSLLNSEYYLTNASTSAGSQSFISPSGSSEIGHSGDGYIRITIIEISSTQPILNFNINNSLKTYDKGWVAVNGELKEIEKIWVNIDGTLKET